MGKTYRTSNGKNVDMSSILARNEKTPAIGNMNVNARGDEISSDGSIVKTRDQVIKEYYNLSTMVPTNTPIPESSQIEEDTLDIPMQDVSRTSIVSEMSEPNNTDEKSTESEATPTGDLASSVASSKTVEQTVQKPIDPKEEDGVTRI